MFSRFIYPQLSDAIAHSPAVALLGSRQVGKTSCVEVMRGKGRVILRAKRDALLGLPKMWRKRREIQKNRKVSVGQIWRVLDKRVFGR